MDNRYVVLDIETTGLYVEKGDRIVEVACLEMINNKPTGNKLHFLVNPQRSIPDNVARIHGITNDSVKYSPKFNQIALDVLKFCRGSHIIIHNAPFDLGFLDYQLKYLNHDPLSRVVNKIIDTLSLARKYYRAKGAKFSLDAMCDRFFIDRSARTLHGALLDCELLLDVYLQMDKDILEKVAQKKEDEDKWYNEFVFTKIDPTISAELRIVRANAIEEMINDDIMENIRK